MQNDNRIQQNKHFREACVTLGLKPTATWGEYLDAIRKDDLMFREWMEKHKDENRVLPRAHASHQPEKSKKPWPGKDKPTNAGNRKLIAA